MLSTIKLALNQPSRFLLVSSLLYSQISLKTDKAVPEGRMNQAHGSLSLGTRRCGQRTNQWHKAEILLRIVTLINCLHGASQNQSCIWGNTLCFHKTAAEVISQVKNHIPRTLDILLTPKWPTLKSIVRLNTCDSSIAIAVSFGGCCLISYLKYSTWELFCFSPSFSLVLNLMCLVVKGFERPWFHSDREQLDPVVKRHTPLWGFSVKNKSP